MRARRFSEEQLQKLPKWAKDIITTMQVDLRDLEEYKATKEGEIKESPHYGMVYTHGPFEEVRHYLPDSSTLVAHLKKTGFKVKMSVDHHHGNFIRLDINDGVVTPEARNVLNIWPTYNRHERSKLYIPSGKYSDCP